MLTTLLFSAAAAAPAFAKSHILAVSVLQNGYALVTRRIDVPPSGDVVLDELPQATQGTIWFTVTDGLKLHAVRATYETDSKTAPVANLFDLLRENVGQQVQLSLGLKDVVVGKLVSISSDTAFLEDKDSTAAYPIKDVSSVRVLGKTKMSNVVESRKRVLDVSVAGNRGGSLFVTSLEAGMNWTPAYSIDISDPAKAKVVLKATVSDDLGKLDGIDVRLVSGYPNTGYTGALDALIAAPTLRAGYTTAGYSKIPYDSSDNTLIVPAPASTDWGGDTRSQPRPSSMDDTNRAGQNEADMFFYTEPSVTLDRGDRAYYVVASGEPEYKQVYTWDVADSVRGSTYVGADSSTDIWHSLSFTNSLGLPLTSGPAEVYKDGELLGQDTLKYASQGAEATVRITKSLDLHAAAADEELDRKRAAMTIKSVGAFDQITLRTTLTVASNLKTVAHLKITRPYTGELQSSDGAKATATTRGVRSVNPSGMLEWERDLKPGGTVTITFETKVFVRSGQ